MISAIEALKRLQEGNRRFVSEVRDQNPLSGRAHRSTLVEGQAPFAIILGCSDSRVPPEIVFDQGLGDLFVVRVAGNIVAPSQVGSIEYAAEHLGTRLVVVLGHSKCGAIQATLEALENPTENGSPNLDSIINCIRPSVETLWESELRQNPESLIHHAVRSNVRASANHMRHGSQILAQLSRQRNGILVVGAEYSLETGEVDFFDGIPADG